LVISEQEKTEQLEQSSESTDTIDQQSHFKTSQYLFEEALQEDEMGNHQQAILLYTEAIDLSIQLV
jgi:hypothetical protein